MKDFINNLIEKLKKPFIPHDFRHCKTYEDFKKEGALFVKKHFGANRTEFYPKSMKKFKEENPDWKPNLDIYEWDCRDNKNDALEPNPLAERIDEKDLPKDKLYYVWIAQKMLPDKFYEKVPYSKDTQ